MSAPTYRDLRIVGDNLHRQLDRQVLWSLGASGVQYSAQGRGGIEFDARILPFKANGERGTRARIMRVKILLNGSDYYDITVGYPKNYEWIEHFSREDVDAFALNHLLHALDWDGDEVLNPRLSA